MPGPWHKARRHRRPRRSAGFRTRSRSGNPPDRLTRCAVNRRPAATRLFPGRGATPRRVSQSPSTKLLLDGSVEHYGRFRPRASTAAARAACCRRDAPADQVQDDGLSQPQIWERRVPEPNYAVELTPPDIEPYRTGNTGIDYVTTFDSGVAGPHVLVTALTHGNEICGAIALDLLFRAGLKPRQGKLTLAFDNVAAYCGFDRR